MVDRDLYRALRVMRDYFSKIAATALERQYVIAKYEPRGRGVVRHWYPVGHRPDGDTDAGGGRRNNDGRDGGSLGGGKRPEVSQNEKYTYLVKQQHVASTVTHLSQGGVTPMCLITNNLDNVSLSPA